MLKSKLRNWISNIISINGQEVITVGLNSNSIYDSSGYVASTNQSSNTINLSDSEPPNILEPTVPGYDFIGDSEGSLYFISKSASSWNSALVSATAAINDINAFGGLISIRDQAKNNLVGTLLASSSLNQTWIAVQKSSDTWLDGNNWNTHKVILLGGVINQLVWSKCCSIYKRSLWFWISIQLTTKCLE